MARSLFIVAFLCMTIAVQSRSKTDNDVYRVPDDVLKVMSEKSTAMLRQKHDDASKLVTEAETYVQYQTGQCQDYVYNITQSHGETNVRNKCARCMLSECAGQIKECQQEEPITPAPRMTCQTIIAFASAAMMLTDETKLDIVQLCFDSYRTDCHKDMNDEECAELVRSKCSNMVKVCEVVERNPAIRAKAEAVVRYLKDSNFLDMLKHKFESAKRYFQEDFNSDVKEFFEETIPNFVEDNLGGYRGSVSNIRDGVEAAKLNIRDTIMDPMEKYFNGDVKTFFANDVTTFFQEDVADFVANDVVNFLQKDLPNAFVYLGTKLDNAASDVSDFGQFLQGVGDNLKFVSTHTKKLSSFFKDDVPVAVEDLGNKLDDAVENADENIKSIRKYVEDKVEDLADSLKSGFDKVGSFFSGLVSRKKRDVSEESVMAVALQPNCESLVSKNSRTTACSSFSGICNCDPNLHKDYLSQQVCPALTKAKQSYMYITTKYQWMSDWKQDKVFIEFKSIDIDIAGKESSGRYPSKILVSVGDLELIVPMELSLSKDIFASQITSILNGILNIVQQRYSDRAASDV